MHAHTRVFCSQPWRSQDSKTNSWRRFQTSPPASGVILYMQSLFWQVSAVINLVPCITTTSQDYLQRSLQLLPAFPIYELTYSWRKEFSQLSKKKVIVLPKTGEGDCSTQNRCFISHRKYHSLLGSPSRSLFWLTMRMNSREVCVAREWILEYEISASVWDTEMLMVNGSKNWPLAKVVGTLLTMTCKGTAQVQRECTPSTRSYKQGFEPDRGRGL